MKRMHRSKGAALYICYVAAVEMGELIHLVWLDSLLNKLLNMNESAVQYYDVVNK